MRRCRLTPKAQADIDSIWNYTVERWNSDQAEKYLRQIADAMALIGDDPLRGRACDHIRAGYRRYAVGAHVLFYRTRKDGVEIIRILHRRMDFERHL
jgi:toxin ParE1/3/4